jgi:hypothetical protein
MAYLAQVCVGSLELCNVYFSEQLARVLSKGIAAARARFVLLAPALPAASVTVRSRLLTLTGEDQTSHLSDHSGIWDATLSCTI